MNRLSFAVVVAFCGLSLAGGESVVLVECPKCDRRMRLSGDGTNATINVCRLKDDLPDEATLKRRIAALTARAEECLRRERETAADDRRCPLMGWSSWNTFGLDISEELILSTARAMATNGLKAAGYRYVNIDDGFFYGRDAAGGLRIHPKRFPRGLKPTVDGIHALGLRAGIYSDAGTNTCGSMWGGPDGTDRTGVASGLYGHDAADLRLHFNELGFDFIKVDYCGGQKQGLDERTRYTEIARAIAATGRTDVRFNVCRWAFPGTWIAGIADSWRTTGDIRASWKSVSGIVGENLYLGAYASAGHCNDMDMLEVGQRKGRVKSVFGKKGDEGLTEDEEVTHFGMWCMMSSPLLVGCDVRTIPPETLRLITNPFLIAMNQNCGLGVQGQVVSREGEAYVLAKDADVRFGRSRYVALYNAGEAEHEFRVRSADLELGGTVAAFDLVDRSDPGEFTDEVCVRVPAHASRFFRLDAERRIERTAYEAETAYLPDYQELKDAKEAKTPYYAQVPGASGGVAVVQLGGRPTNGLEFREVRVSANGPRRLVFRCRSEGARTFAVEIDGVRAGEVSVPDTAGAFVSVSLEAGLLAGVHCIRLANPRAPMPDVDRMDLEQADGLVL